MFVANEDAIDAGHGQDAGGLAFPARVQSAAGASQELDIVSVPVEPLGGLDAGTGQTHADSVFARSSALIERG